MGTDQHTVKPAANNQLIRYLGIWFSFKLSPRHHQCITHHEIDSVSNIIRTKRLTVDQVNYINNCVLIPRLEYRLCTTLFSVLTVRNLYTPMIKVTKQLLQLPGTAKNNILT